MFRAAAFGCLVSALTVVGLQSPAQAVLTYKIYEDSVNNQVIVKASGSLDFTSIGTGFISCFGGGFVDASTASICAGTPAGTIKALIAGPSFFPGGSLGGSISDSGTFTYLDATGSEFYIDSSYVNNDPISSTTVYGGSLSSNGFTTFGLVGSWSLIWSSSNDVINVCVGKDEATACGVPPSVPGPLPLFGASAAFAWSRRLRRRVAPLLQASRLS